MIVLLIAPNGSVASAIESLPLPADGAHEVIVVAAESTDHPGSTTVLLGADSLPGRGRFARALAQSVVGRNLQRLTPADGGRRFYRAARKKHEFRSAARRADLIVALERDGILTAWSALHKDALPTARGVYGIAPATALLKASRPDS